MPTDDAIKAEKRVLMSGRISGAALTATIPEIPFTPMPGAQVARNPGLARWHEENHAAMSRWREEFSAVLARLPETSEPPATP